MTSIKDFRQMALSFPGSVELPHFHLVSFRVKKKIFSTLDVKEKRAMIKLPLNEQSVFCSYNNSVFSPVPGTWGKNGATFVHLAAAGKKIVKEALGVAYNSIVLKKK